MDCVRVRSRQEFADTPQNLVRAIQVRAGRHGALEKSRCRQDVLMSIGARSSLVASIAFALAEVQFSRTCLRWRMPEFFGSNYRGQG